MGDNHAESTEIPVEVEGDAGRRRGPTAEDRRKGREVITRKFAERRRLAEEMFSRAPDIDPRAVNDAIRARLGAGLGCANLYRIKRAIRASLGLPGSPPRGSRRILSASPAAVRSREWRARHRADRFAGAPALAPAAPPPPAPYLPAGLRAAAELVLSEARDAGWYGSISIERPEDGPASIAWARRVARVESGRLTVPGSAQ